MISDALLGLTAAIKRICPSNSCSRTARCAGLCCGCRLHFLPNSLSNVPKASKDLVSATMKGVFVIQKAELERAHWKQVTEMLRKQPPETRCWSSPMVVGPPSRQQAQVELSSSPLKPQRPHRSLSDTYSDQSLWIIGATQSAIRSLLLTVPANLPKGHRTYNKDPHAI